MTVNGAVGVVAFAGDRPYAVVAVAFRDDRIAEIDIIAAPERLAALDLNAAERGSGPASSPGTA